MSGEDNDNPKKRKKEDFETKAEKENKEALEQAKKNPYEIAKEVARKTGRDNPREIERMADSIFRNRRELYESRFRRRRL